MLAAFHEQHAVVGEIFRQASAVLDFDLWSLVQNGPKETLDQTENTQPALLAGSVAVWHLWQAAGGTPPAVVAGHSLGEYSALVAAGVLDFGDAVALVRDRGRYMQQAIPAGQGAMAAILGLPDQEVIELCSRNQLQEIVSVANFNSPGQAVIAGHAAAIERVAEAARTAGARKVIRLDVSVPSHCALMKEVADKFAQRMAGINFSHAVIPIIQNVDAQQRTGPDEIRAGLVQQLHQPVRWTDTIRAMKASGVTRIIECGPGRVLSGLIKRIDRDINTQPVYDPDSLASAVAAA